jgi:hypothetical protein
MRRKPRRLGRKLIMRMVTVVEGNGSDYYNNKLLTGLIDEPADIQPPKNNKIVISSKDEAKNKKDDKVKKNGNEDLKLLSTNDDMDFSKDSVDGIDIDFKLKKKKKSKKEVNKKNEIVIPDVTGGGGGDLFDSIMSKVKDKNKGIAIILN